MWTVLISLWCTTLATHLGFASVPWTTPARAFYVLRGMEGCLLFLTLPMILSSRPSLLQKRLLLLLTLFGATMEALTAICGAAFYWGKGPLPAKADGLMCDAAHPQMLAWTVIAVCAVILWWVSERRNSS